LIDFDEKFVKPFFYKELVAENRVGGLLFGSFCVIGCSRAAPILSRNLLGWQARVRATKPHCQSAGQSKFPQGSPFV